MSDTPPPSDTPVSLLGLGKGWTRVGYGVFALALLAFVLNLTVRPLQAAQILTPLAQGVPLPKGATPLPTPTGTVAVPSGFQAEVVDGMVQAYPLGYRLVGGKKGGIVVKASAVGALSVFVWAFSALSAFVWTLVDIVDRRKRFVWLLPAFICPLVVALHALPLALYLFFGRETIGHGENVQ